MPIAEIVEYSAFMGVDPTFVTALTAAGPDQINLLSHDQLSKYKIVSAAFTTQWEIKVREGHFYLMGTTETNNGYHKNDICLKWKRRNGHYDAV